MHTDYKIVDFDTLNAKVPSIVTPEPNQKAVEGGNLSHPAFDGQALAGTGALVWEGELLEMAYGN